MTQQKEASGTTHEYVGNIIVINFNLVLFKWHLLALILCTPGDDKVTPFYCNYILACVIELTSVVVKESIRNCCFRKKNHKIPDLGNSSLIECRLITSICIYKKKVRARYANIIMNS